MAKKSKNLISTDREVAGARPPADGKGRAEYRISGTPNLVLRVTKAGQRSWVYWVKRPKTRSWQKMTIGVYPAMTLANARKRALDLRHAVSEGEDPIAERDEALTALTVKQLGEKFIDRHAKPKKRSWAEDERTLKRDVNPAIGAFVARSVARSDIVTLLDDIHDRGAPIHANRTLALVRKMFNFAVAEGYLDANPALGIPARAQERVRTRTLSDDEIKAFWLGVDGQGFDEVTRDVLRLQLLLGARVREVTGMARAEVELKGKNGAVWTLPKSRAKGGRDVPRPLPKLALSIIKRRVKAAGEGTYLFASPFEDDQPITPRAPAKAVLRASESGLIPSGFTPHDLRRTCRTKLAQLGVSETVAKKILGHTPPRSDVTASVYDQHTYLPEMKEALQRWERHLAAIVSGNSKQRRVRQTRGG